MAAPVACTARTVVSDAAPLPKLMLLLLYSYPLRFELDRLAVQVDSHIKL